MDRSGDISQESCEFFNTNMFIDLNNQLFQYKQDNISLTTMLLEY